MTQVLSLDQCPPDVRAHFLAMPAFQNAMRITKSATTGTDKTQVVKTLKTSRIIPREEMVLKAANTGGFASILSGSNARNIGSPAHKAESAAPKAISSSPSKPVAPGMSIFKPADPSAPAKALPKANNTHRGPRKHDPVTFASLQQALDTAMAELHQREESERFNAGRSAFARLAPTRKSDVAGGGLGSAHGLRAMGGKLAASILNGTTRKDEARLPTNTGFRAVSGASLK